MTRRTERMNDLLREEISRILQQEVKDPRMDVLFSVTEVEVAPDLRSARVFVSVLCDEEEKAALFAALRHAASFVQRELRGRLHTRVTPVLDFRADDRIARGAEVLRLISEVAGGEPGTGEPGHGRRA